MKPESMDAVFQALAHAMRRRILDILKSTPGASVNEVCEHFDVSRIAVMKHLNLLEGAGLIVSERSGRTRHLYFNAVPIQLIHDRWTSEYSAFWASQVTDLKYMIEAKATGSAKPLDAGDSTTKQTKPVSKAASSTTVKKSSQRQSPKKKQAKKQTTSKGKQTAKKKSLANTKQDSRKT